MVSPIETLVSGSIGAEIVKSGNLQAGVAATPLQKLPEVDVSPAPKVKSAPAPAATFNSFRSANTINPLLFAIQNEAAEKKVDASLQALKAFTATGSLGDAGAASTVSLSA